MARRTVESLLMPGTPTSVALRYASLASRAERTDFDLLEEDVVALDTETTGLSFRDCELIQIAAARISGREVVERFETFVHPSRPIPAEIVSLTGITDLDVSAAPRPREAVASLAEFVGGRPVLAHNAVFDRTFIERTPGGREVSDVWIDTLALSRIALPRLASHRLADMAEAFGCDRVTHRAMDDVDALVGMWRILLLGLTDLPGGLLAHLAEMQPEVGWSFRPVLAHLAAESEVVDVRFSLKETRKALVSEGAGVPRDDAAEREAPLVAVSEEEVAAAFAPGGVVARMYGGAAGAAGHGGEGAGDAATAHGAAAAHGATAAGTAAGTAAAAGGYEDRPEQVAMAQAVRRALETGTHLAVEAGTGVGKSVAYLLPEVLFAQANHITVGVATKTNALTDQLVSHELPALAQALPGGLSFASLKGYEHYPCLRKLERAAGVGAGWPADREHGAAGTVTGADAATDAVAGYDVAHADEVAPQPAGTAGASATTAPAPNAAADEAVLTALAVTYAFVSQSPAGDLDALGIRWRYVPRDLLCTTPVECHRNRCPYFPNECLVHGARRRAAAADVVVTNHSLLLRNVDADGKVLPPVRHWVVDEAHAFEAEARRQWAREVSGAEVRRGFDLLGGVRSGVLHTLLVQVGKLDGSTLHARLLTKVAASAQRAQVACGDFFMALHGLVGVADGGAYDQVTLWIDAAVRESDEWHALDEAGWVALDALEALVKEVAGTTEALSDDSAQLASDLADAGRFARELLDALRLMLEGTDTSYVYFAELSRRRAAVAGATERLVAEKVDVGAEIAARWLPETRSVVFCSATIAVGESFEHFDHAVGLDLLPAGERAELRLNSSFDFDAHMAAVVCSDLPAPGDRRYLAALEDLLFDVHVAMGGSVLTLFTNRREMEHVYAGLRDRLGAVGLEVACQERGGSARRLRERFLKDRSLSLMALRTFWEGFDAAGDTLRCVVIAKLPFAAPNDPLVRERELRDRRSWWRHSLPEAVISVKQAAGRLIRTKSDTGVLVLADSRLVSKRYGRQFVTSLPTGNVVTLGSGNVRRFVETWRAGHER